MIAIHHAIRAVIHVIHALPIHIHATPHLAHLLTVAAQMLRLANGASGLRLVHHITNPTSLKLRRAGPTMLKLL